MSIFNVSVDPKLRNTLSIRQNLMGKNNRTVDELAFLNSNTSWVKLSSSVDINGDKGKSAQANVLAGGTLLLNKPKFGVGTSIKNAYSSVNSNGDKNILGIRAMPGITSVSVDNIGAYGSIRKATVNFQCWDIQQLELLEQLYMRPGYTVLLEYGRNTYLDSNNNLKPVQPQADFFTRRDIDLQVYLKKLYTESLNSGGNYDAFFGYITNYSWSARDDGGYDCKTEILSTGEILESVKVNYSASGGINFGLLSSNAFNGHLFKEMGWVPTTSEAITRINEEYATNALSGLVYELYQLIWYLNYSPNIPKSIASKANSITFPSKSKYAGTVIDFLKVFYLSPKQSETEVDFQNSSKVNYYITLESFCNLLNNIVLPNTYSNNPLKKTKTGDLAKISTKDRDYINKGAEDLLCLFNNHMISVNPDVCMIKNNRYVDVVKSLKVTTVTAPILAFPFPGMVQARNTNIKNWIKKTVQINDNRGSGTLGPLKILFALIEKDFAAEKAKNPSLTEKNYAKDVLMYYQLLRGGEIDVVIAPIIIPGPIIGTVITIRAGRIEKKRSWTTLTPTKDEYESLTSSGATGLAPHDDTIGELIKFVSGGATIAKNLALYNELSDPSNNNPSIDAYNASLAAALNAAAATAAAASRTASALEKTSEEYKKVNDSIHKDFKTTLNNKNYGITGNIYVNLKYLYKLATDVSLMSQDPSGNNILAAMPFLKSMLQGIQSSLGNVNNFEVHIDPIDGIGRIIDVNYTNKDKDPDLFEFQIGSNKSIVRNLSFESQIFSNQSSMIAISAQSDAGKLGLNNSTLVSYNKDTTDRMIAKKDTPLVDGINDTTLINNFVSSLSLIANRFLKPFYSGRLVEGKIENIFNASEAGMYSNSLRDIITFFSSISQTDNKDTSFLPTQISLTLDGIAGWVIGNLFKVDNTFIPQYYKRKDLKSGYIITKIGHQVENNSWTTTIKGYPFNFASSGIKANDTYSYTLVITYNPSLAALKGGSGTTASICGDVTQRKYWDITRYPAVAYRPTPIPEADIVNYLKNNKNYSLSVRRSVLASIGSETGWGKSGINNNINGMQTDGGTWLNASKYIEAVTNIKETAIPSVPGSGRCRSFATYKTWQDCVEHVLSIMATRTEGSGNKEICPKDPNNWTFYANNYAKGWGGLTTTPPDFFKLNGSTYRRAIKLLPV
jgi:hypothetical protein